MRFSRAAYAQNSDFLNRAKLLALFKKDYVPPRLKSSLHNFHGRHVDLVDRYQISRSQMKMDY